MAALRKLGFVGTIEENDSVNIAPESSSSEDEVSTELLLSYSARKLPLNTNRL